MTKVLEKRTLHGCLTIMKTIETQMMLESSSCRLFVSPLTRRRLVNLLWFLRNLAALIRPNQKRFTAARCVVSPLQLVSIYRERVISPSALCSLRCLNVLTGTNSWPWKCSSRTLEAGSHIGSLPEALQSHTHFPSEPLLNSAGVFVQIHWLMICVL